MNPGWAFFGICCLAGGALINPLATLFGAVGASVLLLARINYTLGPIVKLAMAVVRAFIYSKDTCVPELQALSEAMIRWRKI